jgi:hypothetical protein
VLYYLIPVLALKRIKELATADKKEKIVGL